MLSTDLAPKSFHLTSYSIELTIAHNPGPCQICGTILTSIRKKKIQNDVTEDVKTYTDILMHFPHRNLTLRQLSSKQKTHFSNSTPRRLPLKATRNG